MTESIEQDVPVAEFKRNFSRYVDEVSRGRRVRVVRHGRPVGDFVPAGAWILADALPTAEQPGGILALAGLFEEWPEIAEDVEEIVRSRQNAGRRAAFDLD